ncbi:bacteriohopanetetrol glucosamine biosynthesis glycosyltransferase HpnI [Terracidiphilus gabretensis]|uniref:bacteriohopanetetrol glucosamine biosynthesis glycosyltransferase HpnI n=1 Tax=Terracidiphilus gabretensis TaxID=1577687 RepID=UPI00071BA72E|nr:bacteriohopanetetrol glucosamine biosynthesis glycosyltransferase HpnI [Terracidiphilus gabretensis]
MPHIYAHAVELATTVLTVAGMGYYLVALVAAYVYLARRNRQLRELAKADGLFAPPVSILKSLKGLDPGMMEAFRSHCRQSYVGQYEILFGISSQDDPAVAAVLRLQNEFPEIPIRLIEAPERLGTNGKVSTLVQLIPHAAHPYLLINDSDITVSPHYLERVMASFAEPGKQPVGLVTALYRGRAHGTLPSQLESLGISTDFLPSVLLTVLMERGMRFGLGSTLCVSREAVDAVGGLESLVDHLADDYELGVRVHKAGFRVVLAPDVVETSVPAYNWRGFLDHQLRWYRTVRDARPLGYSGMHFTYGLAWAMLNLVASGFSLLSIWLFALAFFLRLAMAMTVGARILSDHQVLPGLWLLPFRDLVAFGLWVAGFAGNTIVWRGQSFMVKKGRLIAQD